MVGINLVGFVKFDLALVILGVIWYAKAEKSTEKRKFLGHLVWHMLYAILQYLIISYC